MSASSTLTGRPRPLPDILTAPACTLGWLAERAGFETGHGVTVKILEGCLAIIPVNNEMQELRENLCRGYKVNEAHVGLVD